MSGLLMGQVWGLQLRRPQRDVLLAMADHADDHGNCYPGVAYLAWKTDYSERQVQRILRELETDGLVEVVEPAAGRGHIRRYQLHIEKGVKKPPFQRPERATPVSPIRPERVTSEAGKGDIQVSPEPSEPSENQRPTSFPAEAGHASGGEVIPLRSSQAVQAANGTLGRLRAEVLAGKRSWSLSEAAKAEWLALLDQVETKVGPPREFVMFYLAVNTGRDVRAFEDIHWQMAARLVTRHRGLVLYGVDQAITRVDVDERDDRGRLGRPFWSYVEAVCQRARHDTKAQQSGGGA